jgi:hypothetical protein
VKLGAWSQALTVPRRAITWRNGAPGVSVGGQWRAVKVAALTAADAVIAEGVTVGERVDLAEGTRS